MIIWRWVGTPLKAKIDYEPADTFGERLQTLVARFIVSNPGLRPNVCYVSPRAKVVLPTKTGITLRHQTLLTENEVILGLAEEVESDNDRISQRAVV